MSVERRSSSEPTTDRVALLRQIAADALRRMYRPTEGLFAFRLRRSAASDVLEGISLRYTAVVLVALADEPTATSDPILAGHTTADVCDRLINRLRDSTDLGEVALALWAARRLNHPRTRDALDRLRAFDPVSACVPTVELAWCLTALSVKAEQGGDPSLAHAIATRLLASYDRSARMFRHWPAGARGSRLRGHVSCFADFVYPIQALSHYAGLAENPTPLDVARDCAAQMCALQGDHGQWWWHFDVRTGGIVERYPVYAVHQEAMAPMALFALEDASGNADDRAVQRGIEWLFDPPEISGSLVDREAGVIWRKVGRHEPGKLVRSVNAATSRLHPKLRLPGLGRLFRPGAVDYESRPYHMAWILHAWSGRRAASSDGRGQRHP
jgi:hypothetical protein